MARTRSSVARVVIAAAAVGAACQMGSAFVGTAPATRSFRGAMRAEGEAAKPKESVALIAVTEESKLTTAGAITGLAGLLLGGVWVGAAGFAAGSYLARKKDDDVSKALNGIAGAGLEVLNFASNLNTKYEVTNKISSSFNDAVKSNNTDTSALDGVSSAVTNFDKDVGIQKTLGEFLTKGGELANQAVTKAIELNDQYNFWLQLGLVLGLASGNQAAELFIKLYWRTTLFLVDS
jgi:hypothetical protein